MRNSKLGKAIAAGVVGLSSLLMVGGGTAQASTGLPLEGEDDELCSALMSTPLHDVVCMGHEG